MEIDLVDLYDRIVARLIEEGHEDAEAQAALAVEQVSRIENGEPL